MNRNLILSELKKYKSSSSIKKNIKKIGIFGSYAKNNNTSRSDIDIFVVLENARMFDAVRIKNDLKKNFHTAVDVVVVTKSTNQFLKQQIKNYGIAVR